MSEAKIWPALPYQPWRETCQTLHLWTQIVGKIRLVQSEWINHSWHVALYVTSRGLTTAVIPHGARTFEIEFDFLEHKLRIRESGGGEREVALRPVSVADFYAEVMAALRDLSLDVKINTMPNELEDAVRFEQDRSHASYDATSAERFWRALVQVDRVLKLFRARFIGKCSPVHFFLGEL